MRASPTRLSGFKLTLPAGWYTLPWYMPRHEVRRLVDLLRMGLEVDYAVELEWDGLEEIAGRANLDKSVAVLYVPTDVDPKSIASVQANLGDVRIGLMLHHRAGDWAAVDWQQHHIKVPLLAAINRELHMGRHPFSELGIDALPLEELANLTAEPAELLELLDTVIDHRLRHAAQGFARADWQRSIDLAVADRLAVRLSSIPSREQAAVLDLALDARQQPLWPALDRREASRALAHVGLAWREGSDVLIGALARQAGKPTVLRRLLTQLPERAWSKYARTLLAEVMPTSLPLPRAISITPEPRYTDLETVWSQNHVTWDIRNHLESKVLVDELDDLNEFIVQFRRLSEPGWRAWNEGRWAMAASVIHAAFMELQDDALVEFDLERGRLHRFDAVDRVLADLPGAEELAALTRWVGIVKLIPRIVDHRHLAILAAELERSLEVVEKELVLSNVLIVTIGDLHALRREYTSALDWWFKLQQNRSEIILRRILANLRIGAFDEASWRAAGYGTFSVGSDHEYDVACVIELLAEQEGLDVELTRADHAYGSVMLTICRAAIALERRDWVLAMHLLDNFDRTATTPETARARLLWAWTRAALGDIDLAGATFEELEQLAASWSDEQLASFAATGRAWVASQGSTG